MVEIQNALAGIWQFLSEPQVAAILTGIPIIGGAIRWIWLKTHRPWKKSKEREELVEKRQEIQTQVKTEQKPIWPFIAGLMVGVAIAYFGTKWYMSRGGKIRAK